MRRITDLQKKVLNYLSDHEGEAVSMEEIGKDTNITKGHVHYILLSLSRRGWVDKKEYVPRSIKITAEGKEANKQ